jgi:phosphoribosylamine---glycine ligase
LLRFVMKILVIGGGGREHALIWKLRQSPQTGQLWCAPGNGGICADVECISAELGDISALSALGERLKPDLTIVGPEQPLVLGLADEFAKRGLAMVGPTRQAAQLEGSKVFAKRFLERHRIPTPAIYGVCESASDAYRVLSAAPRPVVLKADGIAAGKGVLVTSSADEAKSFIERLMEQREFGAAGGRVIIEERLEGRELSYIVLVREDKFLPLIPARDYKRAYDGDTGPNTGGMGAYTSSALLDQFSERLILDSIVEPTIRGLTTDGMRYSGFLYFGLMLTSSGPKVLEFNCRMGDPEAQAIVMRMDFDLVEALKWTAGLIKAPPVLKWHEGASMVVVLAAEGYPGQVKTGRPITGWAASEANGRSYIFHSGTRREGFKYYNSGGRILGVATSGATLAEARKLSYYNISVLSIDGGYFRKDIGEGLETG